MCGFFQVRRSFSAWSILVCGLTLSGCGEEMTVAPVSGIVTLDGAPLPRASVTFLPQPGGRPSYGVTDEKGRYVLEYSLEEAGAEVGPCRVSITTASAGDDEGSPASKERVPKRYSESPIEVMVESKNNTINFDLTSQ